MKTLINALTLGLYYQALPLMLYYYIMFLIITRVQKKINFVSEKMVCSLLPSGVMESKGGFMC